MPPESDIIFPLQHGDSLFIPKDDPSVFTAEGVGHNGPWTARIEILESAEVGNPQTAIVSVDLKEVPLDIFLDILKAEFRVDFRRFTASPPTATVTLKEDRATLNEILKSALEIAAQRAREAVLEDAQPISPTAPSAALRETQAQQTAPSSAAQPSAPPAPSIETVPSIPSIPPTPAPPLATSSVEIQGDTATLTYTPQHRSAEWMRDQLDPIGDPLELSLTPDKTKLVVVNIPAEFLNRVHAGLYTLDVTGDRQRADDVFDGDAEPPVPIPLLKTLTVAQPTPPLAQSSAEIEGDTATLTYTPQHRTAEWMRQEIGSAGDGITVTVSANGSDIVFFGIPLENLDRIHAGLYTLDVTGDRQLADDVVDGDAEPPVPIPLLKTLTVAQPTPSQAPLAALPSTPSTAPVAQPETPRATQAPSAQPSVPGVLQQVPMPPGAGAGGFGGGSGGGGGGGFGGGGGSFGGGGSGPAGPWTVQIQTVTPAKEGDPLSAVVSVDIQNVPLAVLMQMLKGSLHLPLEMPEDLDANATTTFSGKNVSLRQALEQAIPAPYAFVQSDNGALTLEKNEGTPPDASDAHDTAELIDVNYYNVEARSAILELVQMAGLGPVNLPTQQLGGLVRLDLKGVTAKHALDILLELNNLVIEQRDGQLTVVPIHLANEQKIEYKPKQIVPDELYVALSRTFRHTQEVQVTFDAANGLVTVTTPAAYKDIVTEAIRSLDVPKDAVPEVEPTERVADNDAPMPAGSEARDKQEVSVTYTPKHRSVSAMYEALLPLARDEDAGVALSVSDDGKSINFRSRGFAGISQVTTFLDAFDLTGDFEHAGRVAVGEAPMPAPPDPAVTQVVKLQHADPQDLLKLLHDMGWPTRFSTLDPRTGQLILSGPQTLVDSTLKLIEELDVAPAPSKDPELEQLLEQTSVSFVFEKMHVSFILGFIHDTFGINSVLDYRYVTPPAESQRQAQHVTDGIVPSVNLRDVPLNAALEALLRPLNLTYTIEPGYLFITAAPEALAQQETPTAAAPTPLAELKIERVTIVDGGLVARASIGGLYRDLRGGDRVREWEVLSMDSMSGCVLFYDHGSGKQLQICDPEIDVIMDSRGIFSAGGTRFTQIAELKSRLQKAANANPDVKINFLPQNGAEASKRDEVIALIREVGLELADPDSEQPAQAPSPSTPGPSQTVTAQPPFKVLEIHRGDNYVLAAIDFGAYARVVQVGGKVADLEVIAIDVHLGAASYFTITGGKQFQICREGPDRRVRQTFRRSSGGDSRAVQNLVESSRDSAASLRPPAENY